MSYEDVATKANMIEDLEARIEVLQTGVEMIENLYKIRMAELEARIETVLGACHEDSSQAIVDIREYVVRILRGEDSDG